MKEERFNLEIGVKEGENSLHLAKKEIDQIERLLSNFNSLHSTSLNISS
jgi:hypothetical protein